MLKVPMLLMLMAFASLSLYGQGKSPFNQTQIASNETNQMATDLGLNAAQKKQVEAITQTRQDKQAAIRAELKASDTNGGQKPTQAAKDNAKTKRKAMNQEYRTELKKILTPEQFAKWKELKQADREEKRSGQN